MYIYVGVVEYLSGKTENIFVSTQDLRVINYMEEFSRKNTVKNCWVESWREGEFITAEEIDIDN